MPTPRDRRSAVTVALGVLAILTTLSGAFYAKRVADGRAALAHDDSGETVTKVVVCQVATRSLPVQVDLRGYLEGFAEVRVHAEVAGAVAVRNVSDGDTVSTGDALYGVDDTFHRIAVEQARAGVSAAMAERDQAKAAIEAANARLEEVQAGRRNAKIEFDRVERLHREQNAPRIEYDRAETALQRASAAIREAQASVRQAGQQLASANARIALNQAQLARAGETLDRCTIRSPLSGRVDRLLVEQGEYVVPGQPVADVIRLDRMKLFVEVSGAQLALLGEEITAEVVLDAQSRMVHAASLHHVAPRADPVSRKFRLELHLDNPDGSLLSGMFARCRLSAARARSLVVIPASAIVRRFGRDYCHVVTQEQDVLRARLHPVEIRTIPDLPDLVELIEGLVPGDRVVEESQAELGEGSALEIVRGADEQQPMPGD